MRTVIIGSGRVGAGLAGTLSKLGHEVTILDIRTDAFRRLDPGFPGQALRGDGTDEAMLRRAGAEGADWFFALTNGDNRNVLAAQLAAETFGDPARRGQDQRPGARRGLRRDRDRHHRPDELDGRCDRPVHGRAGPCQERPTCGWRTRITPTAALTTSPWRRAPTAHGRPARQEAHSVFVIVVGGGKVGFYLTKELLAEGHELVLMEKDGARAEMIADELGAIVVNRDGCEGTHLAEAGANRAGDRRCGHRRR